MLVSKLYLTFEMSQNTFRYQLWSTVSVKLGASECVYKYYVFSL